MENNENEIITKDENGKKIIDNFIVKHYREDEHPTIKGNGFDGLIVGEDMEEAEEFIAFVNKLIDYCNNA